VSKNPWLRKSSLYSGLFAFTLSIAVTTDDTLVRMVFIVLTTLAVNMIADAIHEESLYE
jgi:hypothetical protein